MHKIKSFDTLTIAIIATVIIILSTTFVNAIVAAPTNYDSMTYHLPRVEHWIQNHSLNFYPTRVDRQLFSAPLAEVLILHLRLLTGSDKYVNIVQWFAFCGSIIAASQIAIRLGATPRAAAISGLFVATLPIGILEATGTQNDLVVGYLLLVLAKQFMVWNNDKCNFLNACLFGLVLGLCVYAKGTAYLYGSPFLVAFIFLSLREMNARAFAVLVFAGIASLVIDVCFLWRVWTAFGSLSYSGDPPTTVERFTVGSIVCQFVYSIASNLNYPMPHVGEILTFVSLSARNVLSCDDSNIIFNNINFGINNLSYYDPDQIGNPAHVFIYLIAASIIIIKLKTFKKDGLILWSVSIACGIFITIAALRWQPWITRLQLPVFLLASPIVAIIFCESFAKLTPLIVLVSCTLAVPCLLLNVERPLVSFQGASVFATDRLTRMFITQAPLYRESVSELVDTIALNKIKRLGIVLSSDDWEYPYWTLLRDRTKTMPEMRSVCFEAPPSGVLEEADKNWQADAILFQVNTYYAHVTKDAEIYPAADVITCDDVTYRKVMSRVFEMIDRNVALNLYLKLH